MRQPGRLQARLHIVHRSSSDFSLLHYWDVFFLSLRHTLSLWYDSLFLLSQNCAVFSNLSLVWLLCNMLVFLFYTFYILHFFPSRTPFCSCITFFAFLYSVYFPVFLIFYFLSSLPYISIYFHSFPYLILPSLSLHSLFISRTVLPFGVILFPSRVLPSVSHTFRFVLTLFYNCLIFILLMSHLL